MLLLLAFLGISTLVSPTPIIERSLPSGWTSQGCYIDNTNGVRALSGASYANSTGMSQESCIAFCAQSGYNYAGVEYAQECYCGYALQSGASQAPSSDCNMACSGSSAETCGAGNRLNVFWNGKNTTFNPGPPGWTSLGCYSDSVNNRTLTYGASNWGNQSIANCTSTCQSLGFAFAGAEYGSECYCGKAISGNGALISNSSCNMGCSGNSSEYCGGSNAMNVYQVAPISSISSSTTSSTNTMSSSSKPIISTTSTASSLTSSTTSASRSTTSSTIKSTTSTSRRSTTSSARTTSSGSTSSRSTTSSAKTTSFRSSSSSSTTSSVTTSTSSTSSSLTTSSSATSSFSTSSSLTTSSMGMASTSSSSTTSSLTTSTTSTSSSLTTSSVTTSTTSTSPSMTTSSSLTSTSSASSSSTTSSLTSSTMSIPSSSTTLSMSTSTAITSSSATSSTLTSTSSTSSSSATSSMITSTTSTSSTTSPPASTAPSCPASNSTIYTASTGEQFVIECGIDHAGGDLAMVQTSTFQGCIESCANNSSCVDVSYVAPYYCYQKSVLGAPVYNSNSVLGARLITGSTSSTTSSTGSVTFTTSSITVSSSQPYSNTSATTSNPTPTGSGLPQNWSYKGCWVDNAHGRILANNIANNASTTMESCVAACQGAGYAIAGIEYSTQCFCGNQVIENGTLAAQDGDCAMTCGGNSNEICGGPNRMSLYSNSSSITVVPVPTPQTSNLPGSWQYQGCVTDPSQNGHALPWQLILTNNNSATTCLSQCSAFGYMYGGMEYGDECYCGDLDDLIAANSTSAPETDCNMACSGNASTICGAGNRLSLYTWTGTPLYQWNYASGNAAGSYEYFVPGVVVPLITVPGKNGKITFVEKSGTSQFGNSSGAYELDPSLAGTFSLAWRTMTGITTDVFCSAGLVLPDAGARIINVGGWSGTSTYGVRFYTPDGVLGTNSTNMWQENAQEVSLQAGRWYPSAMIMTNGSILVVGGEDGSNGKPTPSLELLPTGGPTIYCDWLNATDPNNLYPYLAVLPSGGIFVGYWNQARILDPVTFNTISVLPPMPGSVNVPTSGRTYPFEGTAVLLPQHAPYTEPLTILICGGSGPGAGIALDNCISTSPDVPNATWTLERMPSQRVMSCMVALPDGTYLILNGAHQGVAGFGLASSPNLNAVLYDPTQPVGARMTVMANTTIARLYHSEAVLMDDGRVLVSGSDPQSNQFPEELRVEVFNPPYILNSASPYQRLSFNLTNGDSFAYGASISITVSGGTPARISLLAAVSSTHGNSMGQRTLFPSFSCAGGSCSVQTPPNANVAPPSWYQMFVLDTQGVPSSAQWVRVGGDPGGLGEWPEFADFERPGS